MQLDSPLFETVPLVDEGVLLQPGGRRFVLPVPVEFEPTGAARAALDELLAICLQ